MARCRNCSYFINLRIILLLLIHTCRLSAAVLTYDGCMSDSANSYKMGGWCFYYYRNSSWPNNVPTQNVAQTMCGPKGNLAVGVTYKMLETYKTKYTSASQLIAWIALVRNAASASGWEWKTLLPNGNYAKFPAIMANIPWGSGEPGNDPVENAGWVGNNRGICDVNGDMTGYSGDPMAIICQFVAAYRIAQTNGIKPACILQCHLSVFCISLAFNPTTSDCQIYVVSPEDPRFSGSITVNSAYDWYIRDGMEY